LSEVKWVTCPQATTRKWWSLNSNPDVPLPSASLFIYTFIAYTYVCKLYRDVDVYYIYSVYIWF
jgi:hypothetical protein